MKRKLVLTPVVASLLLAACEGVPNIANLPGGLGKVDPRIATALTQSAQSVQTATKEITEPEEIQIGQGLAQGMLGAAPLFDSPSVQRYVNQVGRWLSLQTNRPDLPWAFGVLDNDNVNAFAAPGGTIFITKGLLARLRSESELAAVLGHEIAHVIQRHHINAMRAGAFGDIAKNFGQVGLDQWMEKKGAGGQIASSIGLGERGAELLKQGFFTKPLDRGLEYEADRMGVIIAARAGYDPNGMIAVLQTLQQVKGDDPFMALLLKTHPTPADRLERLEALIATLDRYQGQDQGKERFAQALGFAGQKPATRPVSGTPTKAAPKPAAPKPAAPKPAAPKPPA